MAVKISVILCTYNRCQSLTKALESLATSTLSKNVEWEVVLVDNNSSDKTREVAESFCRRHSNFRYLFEPQPGKSYALNTGIREARGEILAFVDDDVVVESAWLQNLTAPLVNGKWAGVGGRILPAHSFSCPPWLSLSGPCAMGGILCAHFDLGGEARDLDLPPFGTNMAFHRSMFEKYGNFRTDMGPSPGSEIRSEDTEFGRRLIRAGESLRYVPSAVVYHEVSESRINKEFFLQWWFDYGRAQMRERGMPPDVWGIPRHYISIPKVIGSTLLIRTFRWMRSVNPQRRFFWKCYVWVTVGWIVEMPRLARKAREGHTVPERRPS